ncbi:MAG: bifunctional adenosylcobinamide kinase/adenosylcobinamide-phosphate guanylyltransferase [Tissierellia bacterium]|nr:bifunctional adenosylcobinamide kinase/adenosylcobinamide-phosphate guanylyltransferase [Tissierellia bacterium]
MIRLITGGARSGKSTFAEELFQDRPDVLYIATSKPQDGEMRERVRLHQIRRPESWGLLEADEKLAEGLGEGHSAILLDDITNMIGNYFFRHQALPLEEGAQRVEEEVTGELSRLIERAREEGRDLNLVTNEVGSATVPMDPLTRAFRDSQGRVNQFLGKLSDEVYLVVCGQPLKIKGQP